MRGGAEGIQRVRSPEQVPQDCISEIHYPLAVADSKLPTAFVSASEAKRTFSALLRQVTWGQTFAVLFHRLPVATLAATSATQGGMGASRHTLLTGLTIQPTSGEPRSWQREMLYE